MGQKRLVICFLFATFAALSQGAFLRRGPPVGPYRGARASSSNGSGRELIQRCKTYFRNATLDHFSWVRTQSFTLPIKAFKYITEVFDTSLLGCSQTVSYS